LQDVDLITSAEDDKSDTVKRTWWWMHTQRRLHYQLLLLDEVKMILLGDMWISSADSVSTLDIRSYDLGQLPFHTHIAIY